MTSPSLWGDGEADLVSFMVQPANTFWYVQYGGKVPPPKMWMQSYGIYVHSQGRELCLLQCQDLQLFCIPKSIPEAMLLTLWSWSGSWPLFMEQVFVSLTCMRGEQRKLWLGLCKLEKEKGEISEEGGKKLNPPTITAQIFLELFVFSLSSVRMEKRLQLQEELRVSRHFIPAELMMLF